MVSIPSHVTLVAVTKKQSSETINQYLGRCIISGDNTLPSIGENYLQEYAEKKPHLLRHRAHFIGHLQSNKAKQAVQLFDCIETVDSLKLIAKLETAAKEIEKILPIYIQINISQDPAKSGVMPDSAPELIEATLACTFLRFSGLMCITAQYETAEEARPDFRAMQVLAEQLKTRYTLPAVALSMGMSNDYLVAIEEGATSVRLGSILFGERI